MHSSSAGQSFHERKPFAYAYARVCDQCSRSTIRSKRTEVLFLYVLSTTCRSFLSTTCSVTTYSNTVSSYVECYKRKSSQLGLVSFTRGCTITVRTQLGVFPHKRLYHYSRTLVFPTTRGCNHYSRISARGFPTTRGCTITVGSQLGFSHYKRL